MQVAEHVENPAEGFLTHLKIALLAGLCLLVPEMRALLAIALAPFLDAPAGYLGTGLLIFTGLITYAFYESGVPFVGTADSIEGGSM